MGVQHLWEVLKEVKTEIKIDEIRGKTLAVDLATWICESEGVKPLKAYVSRPYLRYIKNAVVGGDKNISLLFYFRNLFFRVSAFMKAGLDPVFVLAGNAPDLKLQTIGNRLHGSRFLFIFSMSVMTQ